MLGYKRAPKKKVVSDLAAFFKLVAKTTKQIEMANTYRMSDGSRITKAEIDKRVHKAKAQKLEQMMEDYGYVFCEDCGKNDCKPVDCSHDISVKECQESGRTELAWDVGNITMRGRSCHQKYDGTYLGSK